MTWGELHKLWWLSIDVLVGRHVEIDENKGAVGTLEIKRARPRKFWTVSHRRPVQLKSRRMDCYKDTEQEVERVVSIWNWQLFQRRRRGTRGDTRWIAYPCSHLFGHNSIFFWYKSNTLSACRQLNQIPSPSSFILRRGSKPLSVTIQAKLYFYHFFVRILPFYGYFCSRTWPVLLTVGLTLSFYGCDYILPIQRSTEPSFKHSGTRPITGS